MLHEPTDRLKQVSTAKDGYMYVEAARYLYGIDAGEGKERGGLLRSLLGKTRELGSKELGTQETGDVSGC
jgi:hypothetical protein